MSEKVREIIGNTTATPNPRPDWNQDDSTKPNYIENKPEILTEDDVVSLIIEHVDEDGNIIIDQIQPDWTQDDETKANYIKNKPAVLTEEDIVNIIAKYIGDDGITITYTGEVEVK